MPLPRIAMLASLLLAPAAHAACLPYEGRQALVGTLVARTFAGPPNYQSVSSGDRPERYWLLRLAEPICVAAPKAPADGGPVEAVEDMQLVLTASDFTRYRPLLGHRVRAEGTFMAAMTGHHHTAVLLDEVTLRGAR